MNQLVPDAIDEEVEAPSPSSLNRSAFLSTAGTSTTSSLAPSGPFDSIASEKLFKFKIAFNCVHLLRKHSQPRIKTEKVDLRGKKRSTKVKEWAYKCQIYELRKLR